MTNDMNTDYRNTELTIGKLAKAADVSIETIRFYQRRGLLAAPLKPLTGYRRYNEDAVKRVRFIKQAQILGFTLAEVMGLLQLDNACACAETKALATHKLALIEQKIAGLTLMQRALTELVQQCNANASNTRCPIIDGLNRMSEEK